MSQFSSVYQLQSSSTPPLQISTAMGLMVELESSQSTQVWNPSPSKSPVSSGTPLQSLSAKSQTSALPGKLLASPSSQSPSHGVTPSPSPSSSS